MTKKDKLTSVQNEHPHCMILVIFSVLYSPRHNLQIHLLGSSCIGGTVVFVDSVKSGTKLSISLCCLLLRLLLATGKNPPPDTLREYFDPAAANDNRLEQREHVAIEPQFLKRLSGLIGSIPLLLE